MSIELAIYLAGFIGEIKCVLTLVAIGLGMAILFHALFIFSDCAPYTLPKKLLIAFTCTLLVGTVFPRETTLWLMAGAHITKDAIETEVGKKVIAVINKKLDEVLANKEKDK